jgi:hypothetical protein
MGMMYKGRDRIFFCNGEMLFDICMKKGYPSGYSKSYDLVVILIVILRNSLKIKIKNETP